MSPIASAKITELSPTSVSESALPDARQDMQSDGDGGRGRHRSFRNTRVEVISVFERARLSAFDSIAWLDQSSSLESAFLAKPDVGHYLSEPQPPYVAADPCCSAPVPQARSGSTR